MKVPLLDLVPQHEPILDELLQAVRRVIESNAFVLGETVKDFEAAAARYCGADHAIGVSSGTDALLVSLMALDVGPGDEVVTTPFSFFATAGAIARLGAKPVFADIDPLTFNLDPAAIEPAITKATKAIIPVHLYGQCADMEPILAVARSYDLKVVEDAAQAIGAAYKDGRRAGAMGDLGCLSFFPSKNLGAFGDGGLVLTNDARLAEKIRILRVHGAKPKYHHQLVGGNFRLDALQAAVLKVKLNYLDDWTAGRRENADSYDELFAARQVSRKGLVETPHTAYAGAGSAPDHIYNQYVIRTAHRDGLRTHLRGRGVGTEVYYPIPLHLLECFTGLSYGPGDFPVAEGAAREALALPVYPGLTASQLEYVVDEIEQFATSLSMVT